MKLSILLAVCTLLVISASTIQARSPQNPKSPAELRKMAADYYQWRNENFPVFSSDAGLHTWDNVRQITLHHDLPGGYRRKNYAKLQAIDTKSWTRTIGSTGCCLRSTRAVVFFNRVIDFEQSDPQTYVNECSNGIFSLLKKEYDTPRNRALSATASLNRCRPD